MRIAAYLPLSLCDYPGRVAAVVFTQGCDYNCPWCHNRHLIPAGPAPGSAPLLDVADVLRKIAARKKMLEGLVVTGGEPTVQSDLLDFLRDAKAATGLLVKLDTNGSNPDIVRRCIAAKAVDFIAMDIKAPWDKYERLTGIRDSGAAPRETMALIAASGLPHQFRTTRVDPLLSETDYEAIRASVPAGSSHVWQKYRAPGALPAD